MTEVRIREKIMENPYGKGALIGFENCVMPVEFFKGSDGYYIYKANTKHMLDDMICHSQNVEGLVQFMQGALWFRLNGKVSDQYESKVCWIWWIYGSSLL